MKVLISTLTLIAIALFTPISSFAQSDDDTGFYLAFGVGLADAKSQSYAVGLNDEEDAYSVRAGYMFFENFGIEASYYDFGEFHFKDTNSKLGVDGYGAALVGSFPFGPIDIIVKGGAIRVDLDASKSIPLRGKNAGRNNSSESTEGFGAVAGEWDFGNYNIFLEYFRLLDGDDIDIDLYTAGLKYEF